MIHVDDCVGVLAYKTGALVVQPMQVGQVATRPTPVSWSVERLGLGYLIWRHVALLFREILGFDPWRPINAVSTMSDLELGIQALLGTLRPSLSRPTTLRAIRYRTFSHG